jgi:hypothetical protein
VLPVRGDDLKNRSRIILVCSGSRLLSLSLRFAVGNFVSMRRLAVLQQKQSELPIATGSKPTGIVDEHRVPS